MINQSEFSKRPPRQTGAGVPALREEGWLSLGQRQLRGGLAAAPPSSMRRSSERGGQAAPTSAQWEDRTQKLEHERFPLDISRSFSSMRPGLSSLLLTSELVLLAAGAQTRKPLSSLLAQIVVRALRRCPVETHVLQESSETQVK